MSQEGPQTAISMQDDYGILLEHVRARFLVAVAQGSDLFTTDAEGLFQAYLESFPDNGERQHHNCSACRRFIEHFGGLVTIDTQGRTTPAVLDLREVPPRFQEAIASMARLVRKARVTGVFYSSHRVLGTPLTGPWRHLSVTLPEARVHSSAVQTAGQAMAEKRSDYATVSRALAEFTRPMLEQALTLLKTESLYQSQRVLGAAQWLHDLHRAREAAVDKTHVTWRAVASAPAGFCHPRASMIGTLLEDIAAGLPFEEVSRRFAQKMHPLRYMRPQAAPAAGTIAQAEKLVAQLGIAPSLQRRYAQLEEIEAIWKPAPRQTRKTSGGVFGHLKTREDVPQSLSMPPVTMTWEKFSRTVLPAAESIEFLVGPGKDNFTALLTAVHPEAPPILQWDLPERRNPVSWYVWAQGSPPQQWGLVPGTACPVTAVTLQPTMWGNPDAFPHQGKSVIFLLEGARETQTTGACLFPAFLKSELHGVRSVIEAYSKSATLEGAEAATACGIRLQQGGQWNHVFRVTSAESKVDYRLDRWD